MSLYIRVLVCVLPILINGCATSMPAGNKPVHAGHDPKQATVYVFNTLGGWGTSCDSLRINGREIGGLKNNYQYTWFYVLPGSYQITINDPAFKDRKLAAKEITAQPGQEIYLAYRWVRTSSDASLIADMVKQATTGEQGVAPDQLEVLSPEEADAMIDKYTLVGNTLDGSAGDSAASSVH